MGENDFLRRRTEQLKRAGRAEADDLVIHAEAMDKTDGTSAPTACTVAEHDEIIGRVGPEHATIATAFIKQYNSIINQLGDLTPPPTMIETHGQYLKNFDNKGLYRAIMSEREMGVRTKAGFYTALVNVIKQRGLTEVILAGIKS